MHGVVIVHGALGHQEMFQAGKVLAGVPRDADMAAAHAPREGAGARALFRLTKLRLLATAALRNAWSRRITYPC